MAIRWNATTKKWVIGTGAVVGATLLILALCKSCDAEQTTKEIKKEVKSLAGQVDSVAGQVVSVEESTEQSLAEMGQDIKELDGRVDNLTEEFIEHRDSTIAQGVHQAAARPAVAPAPKPAPKPAAKPVETPAPSRPAPRRDTVAVRPVAQVVVNPQEQSGVVQQAATVAPTNVNVNVEGENRGATVVGTSVSATQSEAGNNNTVVQQYAADAPTDVQITVSGDNRGVVAVGTNVHVEQTVLPDDYVEVRVTYRETVVRDPKAWKKYARRCRGR